MDCTTNGYFPLPAYGDYGCTKYDEYNTIMETADTCMKKFEDGSFDNNLCVCSTNAFYFGDASTNGSWRLIRSGSDLMVQIRIGGTWTNKGAFTC